MTVQPSPGAFALDRFLLHQERKDLLRFVACGSVDHGKSTLIGRLLYGADLLFEDQRDALATESRKHGTQERELDYSLLLDGLAAEREQNITIDVAYRFFATERRKFIVADTPGHEQYTRNMATGASTADLALILVSAEAGLTRQTKRHAMILATIGVRHLVVAVNKMDLVDWSQSAFQIIEAQFRAFAAAIGVNEIACIPLSARGGDNVVAASANMDWYDGPTLLEYLENVPIVEAPRRKSFRMPIQLVNRPSAQFRGYSGRIAGGEAYPGMPVAILPSGQISSIDRIVTYEGDLDRAEAGQSVTIVLADEIDASRGDVIAEVAAPPAVVDRLTVRIVWMGKDALASGRRYLLKAATATAKASIEPTIQVFDLDTGDSAAADRLFINDIGDCVVTLDRPLALDRYADSKETGSFILIDPESFDTVGMGLVRQTADGRKRSGRLLKALRGIIAAASAGPRKRSPAGESRLRSVVKAISWRGTGSVDTFIVTLVVTGNYTFAGSVALTEIATKVMLYYFHERMWSWIPWGR